MERNLVDEGRNDDSSKIGTPIRLTPAGEPRRMQALFVAVMLCLTTWAHAANSSATGSKVASGQSVAGNARSAASKHECQTEGLPKIRKALAGHDYDPRELYQADRVCTSAYGAAEPGVYLSMGFHIPDFKQLRINYDAWKRGAEHAEGSQAEWISEAPSSPASADAPPVLLRNLLLEGDWLQIRREVLSPPAPDNTQDPE